MSDIFVSKRLKECSEKGMHLYIEMLCEYVSMCVFERKRERERVRRNDRFFI